MWQIEPDRPELINKKTRITLTKREWLLLDRLIRAKGGVLDRGQLMETLYPEGDYPESDRTIDCHVKRIRAKIRKEKSNDNPIKTVNSWGYQWKNNQ